MPDEVSIVTLVDENGQEQDFAIEDIVEVDETRYAILVPAECLDDLEDEDVCEEAFIFRIEVDDDGEEYFTDIEDYEEYERVLEELEALDDDEFFYDDYDEDDDDDI